MRKFLPVAALLFSVAGLSAAAAFAAPKAGGKADKAPAPKADLSTAGMTLGTPVCGPALAAEDLKKVIVIDYWGDKCGPCIQSIPHVCELQKKFGRDKVTFIANQVWTKDVAAAKKVWVARAPKENQVSVINHGSVKGANPRGVPHAYVFGKDGKLVWEGHPAGAGLEQAIKTALGE